MCRFYTAGRVNKMAVSETGSRAVKTSHTGYVGQTIDLNATDPPIFQTL